MISLKEFQSIKLDNLSSIRGGWTSTDGADGTNCDSDAYTIKPDGSKRWWCKNGLGAWEHCKEIYA